MKNSKSVSIKDGTCNLLLETVQNPNEIDFTFKFNSTKINPRNCSGITIEDELAFLHNLNFECSFKFVKDENLNVENVYFSLVNYLLHFAYDDRAMMDAEENAFCEINNCLEDHLAHWEQGKIYIDSKNELFHQADFYYSITDIINITEGKLKSSINLLLQTIK